MIVSLGAGPWDQLFGGGNIPTFVLASISALVAGVIAINMLPTLNSSSYKPTGFHFGWSNILGRDDYNLYMPMSAT